MPHDIVPSASIIAKALQLARPLRVLDLETTGTNPETDRIIEIAVVSIAPDGTATSWSSLIDPGIPIPSSVTEVHGISNEDVAGAPVFADLAPALVSRLADADLCGYGLRRFDLRMLAAEFDRAGFHFDPEGCRVVDAQEIFFKYQPRDLSAALRHYCGDDHSGAHRALDDVQASIRVLAGQLVYHEPDGLPFDLDRLHALGRPEGALDQDGKIVWRDGAARIAFGKHNGTRLRDLDRGYLRWMLGQSFGSSTVRIVEAALRGEYPTGPLA